MVRHGETDWNAAGRLQGKTDIPLNDTGIGQAKEAAAHLKNSEWDVIITSPLKRARRTAEIIGAKVKVPIVDMADFQERGYGQAEGLLAEERLEAFPDKVYPGAETIGELKSRVMNGINEINREYNGKKILLVAHGGVINAILSELSMGEIGTGKTKLINTCLSNIDFMEEKWNIRDYNQVGHLSSYSDRGGFNGF